MKLQNAKKRIVMRAISRVLVVVLSGMACTGMAFGKSSSSVTLNSSSNPSTYGNLVTFTATVTPSAASGTVTFMDRTTPLGAGTINKGTVTFRTSTLTAGPHSITATYGGNATYEGSMSTPLAQTVNQAPLTVTVNNISQTYGAVDPTKFTCNITGFVKGDTLSVVSGKASLTTKATDSSPPGTYAITALKGTLSAANYTFLSPPSTYVNGTLTITRVTSITVTSSLNPSTYGTSVTFTAKLTPSMTGSGETVRFYDNKLLVGTGVVGNGNGVATYTTSSLTVGRQGTHAITAVYPGDTKYSGSTSSVLTQTVRKAPLTVTANSISQTYGAVNPAAFTCTITGFVNGETASVVGGACSATVTATDTSPPNTYTIVAAQGTLSAANYDLSPISHANPNGTTYVNGTLTITQATPTITWTPPLPIGYGTALSAAQLDATANVAGAAADPFVYSPSLGTVPAEGMQTLSVMFTPYDTTDYTTATATVLLMVGAQETYSARTDDCERGNETAVLTSSGVVLAAGCVSGATTGEAGSPMSFLYRPTDMPPFAANAPANTDAYDPDFGSHLILLTDTSTGKTTASYSMGDTGAWNAFSSNSGMLLVMTSSGRGLFYINPSQIRSGCSAGACTRKSNITTGPSIDGCTTGCTVMDSNGSETFSRSDPYVIYELQGNNTTINELEICPLNNSALQPPSPYCSVTGPDTFARVPYVDLTSDSPVACSILPASNYKYMATWNSTFDMSNDGSFSLALAGGADWQPDTVYITNDWTSFIVPQKGNPKHHGFVAIAPGTSGGTPPVWPQTKGVTVTEPTTRVCGGKHNTRCASYTLTWMDIGPVNGQNTGIDAVNYTAGVGCSAINTYIGQVRRGTGVSWPGEPPWQNGWPALDSTPTGFWQTDDPLLCQPWGVTPSNPPSGTCPLTRTPSFLHAASSITNPEYAAISNNVGGPNGGTFIGSAALYTGPWFSGQLYTSLNGVVYDPTEVTNTGTLNFYSPTSAGIGCANPSASCATTSPSVDVANQIGNWALTGTMDYGMTWDIPTLTFRTCTQMQCTAHSPSGYLDKWSGGYYVQRIYSQPETYICQTSAKPYTYYQPDVLLNGPTGCVPGDLIYDEPNPGSIGTNSWSYTKVTPTPFPSDSHVSALGLGTQDTGNIIFFLGDVPMTTSGSIKTYAQEIVGGATGLGSVPAGTRYRFAHNFNTGSSPFFAVDNAIGASSEDGQWAAVATDMMGTRGSISPDWKRNYPYAWGAFMYPACNSTSGICTNAGRYDFQATTVTGNSAGNEPAAWCQTPGCTVQDGGVTWTNLGASCNQLRGSASDVVRTGSPIPTVPQNTCIYPAVGQGQSDIFCTTEGGTPSSTAPQWVATNTTPAFCPNYGQCPNGGGAGSDGSVTWFNEGANDCRSDIMLVDLMSASAHQ